MLTHQHHVEEEPTDPNHKQEQLLYLRLALPFIPAGEVAAHFETIASIRDGQECDVGGES